MLQDVSPHGYKKEKNCNTNQKPNSLDPQCNLELSGVVAFHTHFGSFVLIKVLIRSSSLICEEYLSSNASMNSTIQFYPKIASLKLHYNFKLQFQMSIQNDFLEFYHELSEGQCGDTNLNKALESNDFEQEFDFSDLGPCFVRFLVGLC